MIYDIGKFNNHDNFHLMLDNGHILWNWLMAMSFTFNNFLQAMWIKEQIFECHRNGSTGSFDASK